MSANPSSLEEAAKVASSGQALHSPSSIAVLRHKRRRKKSKVPAPLAALEDFNLSDVSDTEVATLSETEELDLKIKNTLSRSDMSTYNLPQQGDEMDVGEDDDEGDSDESEEEEVGGDGVITPQHQQDDAEEQQPQEQGYAILETEDGEGPSTPRASTPQEMLDLNVQAAAVEEEESMPAAHYYHPENIPTINIEQYEDYVEQQEEQYETPQQQQDYENDANVDYGQEEVQEDYTNYSEEPVSDEYHYEQPENVSEPVLEEPLPEPEVQPEEEEEDTSPWPYSHIGRTPAPSSPPSTSNTSGPPQRPPPIQKIPPPERPPPPSASATSKKANANASPVPIAPPPENQRKLRDSINRRYEPQESHSKSSTFFPFRSHFEKKPLVPNPKRAFQNFIHKEDKKTRRMKKEQEQMEKLLSKVDPDEVRSEHVSDEFKAFQALQQRIQGTVTGVSKLVSEKESKQMEIERLLKQVSKPSTKSTYVVSNSDSPSWSKFEESHAEGFSAPGPAAPLGTKTEDLLGLDDASENPNDSVLQHDPFGVGAQEDFDPLNANLSPAEIGFDSTPLDGGFEASFPETVPSIAAESGEPFSLLEMQESALSQPAIHTTTYELEDFFSGAISTPANQLTQIHPTSAAIGLDEILDFTESTGVAPTVSANSQPVPTPVEIDLFAGFDPKMLVQEHEELPATQSLTNEEAIGDSFPVTNSDDVEIQIASEDLQPKREVEEGWNLIEKVEIASSVQAMGESESWEILDTTATAVKDEPVAVNFDPFIEESVHQENSKPQKAKQSFDEVDNNVVEQHLAINSTVTALADDDFDLIFSSPTVETKVTRSTSELNATGTPFDGKFDMPKMDEGISLFQEAADANATKDINQNNAFGDDEEVLAEDFEMPNPFRYDRFTEAKAAAIVQQMVESKKPVGDGGISIIPRARPRPPTADPNTLSGNNPFRKGSIRDDVDLSTLEPVLQLLEEEQPVRSVLQAVGIDGEVTPGDELPLGFDPLQTIYPESDHSGDEEGQGITVCIKKPTANHKSAAVPLLPAPPKLEDLRAKEVSMDDEVDDFASLAVSDRATEVWNSATVAPAPAASAGDDVAFHVDWGDVASKPPGPVFSSMEEAEVFEPFDNYVPGMTWRVFIRMPEKKKKTKQFSRHLSDRYWKEVCVRLEEGKDRPLLLVSDPPPEDAEEEDIKPSPPLRTICLEPVMQLSRDKLQQYDKYGKLHIFKINHIVYKEVVGMRTEKFTFKTLQNMVGHKPKGNMVFDHMPVRTEIIKFGSLDKTYLRSLMNALEDTFMRIPIYRDTSLNYTKEELCCYVQDEYEARLDATCNILKQKARTRISFAGFVMGRPYVILGINDIWRFGKEIVRRQDIIPMMHDEWIHIYEPQFHSCINMEEYAKDHMIKFHPLDGCKFELMRFRVSLRENRELPLTCTCTFHIDKLKVNIRCDLLAPGFFSASKRHGSTHCNDIEIRIPIPEEWIYHFRVEGRTKYNSMHSTLRKPGKIKGFERIANIANSLLPASLMEASTGVAKYEHLYKAIVWRIPQLPEKRESAFKPHLLTCKLTLGAHDPVPDWDNLKGLLMVEYSMNNSTVSGATVRSISVEQHEAIPEKFVKYLAKYEYAVDMKYELGERRAPALKSILDQETSGEEEEEEDEKQDNTTEPQVPSASPSGQLVEDDLLGVDLGSGPPPAAAVPSNHMDDLDDLFASLSHTASSLQPAQPPSPTNLEADETNFSLE